MGLICLPMPSVPALRVGLVFEKNKKEKLRKYPSSFSFHHIPNLAEHLIPLRVCLSARKLHSQRVWGLAGEEEGLQGALRCVRCQRTAQKQMLKSLRDILQTSNREHLASVLIFHRVYSQSYTFSICFWTDKQLRGTRDGKLTKVLAARVKGLLHVKNDDCWGTGEDVVKWIAFAALEKWQMKWHVAKRQPRPLKVLLLHIASESSSYWMSYKSMDGVKSITNEGLMLNGSDKWTLGWIY